MTMTQSIIYIKCVKRYKEGSKENEEKRKVKEKKNEQESARE